MKTICSVKNVVSKVRNHLLLTSHILKLLLGYLRVYLVPVGNTWPSLSFSFVFHIPFLALNLLKFFFTLVFNIFVRMCLGASLFTFPVLYIIELLPSVSLLFPSINKTYGHCIFKDVSIFSH